VPSQLVWKSNVTEPVRASSSVAMQWPAVMIRSGAMRVQVQLEIIDPSR
jgi:hypothetical protein